MIFSALRRSSWKHAEFSMAEEDGVTVVSEVAEAPGGGFDGLDG